MVGGRDFLLSIKLRITSLSVFSFRESPVTLFHGEIVSLEEMDSLLPQRRVSESGTVYNHFNVVTLDLTTGLTFSCNKRSSVIRTQVKYETLNVT